MGRDVVPPFAVVVAQVVARRVSCLGLRYSGFCLQFTRVSLRRGLNTQRSQQRASKNLHKAC